MLVALFGLLFLGAAGADSYLAQRIDALQKSAKTAIVDTERRGDAEDVLKAMEDRLKARDKEVGKAQDNLGDLIEDHEVTDAALEAAWDPLLDGVDSFHTDMIDLRSELKQHVTREEWAQLFPGQ